jgi:hypothetical protein
MRVLDAKKHHFFTLKLADCRYSIHALTHHRYNFGGAAGVPEVSRRKLCKSRIGQIWDAYQATDPLPPSRWIRVLPNLQPGNSLAVGGKSRVVNLYQSPLASERVSITIGPPPAM